MDMLSFIELNLKETLKRIDMSTPAPSGYPYYNTVTIVNYTDEASGIDYGKYPMLNVYLEPGEDTKRFTANSYINQDRFKIEGKVALLDESDNPRFDINVKMNELLSDIKAVLGNHPTLNCSCDDCFIINSSREYNGNKADVFRVGQLNVWVTVKYSQLQNNPNKRCVV